MTSAVIADALGPIENYQLREFDPGAPAENQVRIAVKAAGVSFVDVLNATGKYQAKAPVPFTPGSEFAGIITAVGSAVRGFAVRQKVMASSWGGAFAEAALVPAAAVSVMPEAMSFATAAVFKVSALTSWHGLVDRAQLSAGETLLVLGAGGATGLAAVQIGRYLGARVIASASSAEKRQLALSAGADIAIAARSDHWRAELKEAAGGRAINVVFDPVGGASTEPAFRSLAVNGRHLVVGFPAGISTLATNLPLLKAASLMGVNLQQLTNSNPELAAANGNKILALAEQGLLHPVVAACYPLAEFATAMNQVTSGDVAGRIVLVMD